MLTALPFGELELRRARSGGKRLRGRFPYNRTAVLSDGGPRGGRPRKERIAPRAFGYNVEAKVDIRLLVGHDWGKPLASRKAGTLDLEDSDEALTFEARIAPQMEEVSYVRDTLSALDSGLIVGVSPGFRLPPPRAVAQAETFEQEPDDGPGSERRGAIVRTVLQALLFELSLVTAAAYSESEVEEAEARAAWPVTVNVDSEMADLHRALSRWRA